jgi:hypothetical protein
MSLFNEKFIARAGALLSIVVLSALGPNMLYSSSVSEGFTSRVVLQGSDVDALTDLVESVGGTVTAQLDVIKAVDAELTQDQLIAISRSSDVHRIILDQQASVDVSDWVGADSNFGKRWNMATVDVTETDRDYGKRWNMATVDVSEADADFGKRWNM